MKGAFSHCSKLSRITIPSSVTSIAEMVFIWCRSLERIDVDTNNLHYSSIDGVLFNKKQKKLIRFPQAKGGNYVIPGSVTSIWKDAFFKCAKLKHITIPDSVSAIKEYAFYECKGLKSINIPEKIKSIGDYAFNKCTSLTSVYYMGAVPKIEDCNLYDCTPDSLISYYPKGDNSWKSAIKEDGTWYRRGTATWTPKK